MNINSVKMKQTALITGASSGIGLEFARIFAHHGYDLVLVARSADKLNQVAQELSQARVKVIAKDLSKETAPQEIFDELVAEGIQIDVLVNNAGFGDFGFFHESNWEKQVQMIDLNIRALTELTYLFGSLMVARKQGKVLNVASTASFQPGPLMSVYFATKHYVLAFSEAIANEWKSEGVTVTTLCPGPTESAFQNAAAMEESGLVKGQKMPSSKEVAQFGFSAMNNGKTVAIHGWKNKFLVSSVRFMPRNLVTKVIRMLSERN